MVLTNPEQIDYEHYATEELISYVKENVCTQVSEKLEGLLESYCKTMVETGRPQIEQLIAQQTKRRNFLLFSIYETELSFPSPVPSYEFETFGVLQQFFTYEAEQL